MYHAAFPPDNWTIVTGTEASAYPTSNGWAWASKPGWPNRWEFTIELSPTDPRYRSAWAGDTRRDHCFFCGETADPRTSEHYQDPFGGVPPTAAHADCVEDHMSHRSFPLA